MHTPFDRTWATTGPKEGGYVDHPADRGGPTNHGITERVARANGYTGRMIDLTPSRAKIIGKTQYWDVLNLDKVAVHSERIAAEMFDTIFNGGDVGAWLQRLLNVLNRRGRVYPDMQVDGRIGPLTLEALRAYLASRPRPEGELVLLEGLNHIQGERFIRIAEANATQEDFIYGWLRNRASMKGRF